MQSIRFIAAAVLAAGLASAAPARAATTTVTFAATGSEQAFTVPAFVTGLHVVAIGAHGGPGIGPAGTPGNGAQVEADVPVSPGQTLFVEVGTTPPAPQFGSGAAGGFNGGGAGAVDAGGGGGAADVRTETAGAADSLDSRLIVAAGGAGAGAFGTIGDPSGGNGGDAGGLGTGAGSISGGFGGGPGGDSFGGTPGSGGSSLIAPGGTGGAGAAGAGGGGGGGGGSNLVPVGGSAALDATGEPVVRMSYQVPTTDLSATSLAFGGVQALGTVSAPQALTIANHGSIPLAITGLSFAGAAADDFFLGSSTCGGAVPVGSSCTVTVRFAPLAGGARTGRLVIASNAPESGVDLSGTGGSLPAGVRGETGPAGATGAPGAPRATGAPGAPGAVELVTCTTKKVKKRTKTTCSGGLVSGPLKFTFGHGATVARATLVRGRTVVACGTAVRHGKRMRLLLEPNRALRGGSYTLRLPHTYLTVALR